MQTILQILKMAGGWHPGLHLHIDNPPYMALVIEAMDGVRPDGTSFNLRSSLRRTERRRHARPQMCFELGLAGGAYPSAFYYRNDYLGVEQEHRARELCSHDRSPRGALAFRPVAAPNTPNSGNT
jgi:hypothetical protein